MRQMDVANGKVVYTPVLSPSGTFKSDLTVMRLGDEQFRVVTGGAHGMADMKWYADHAAGRRQRADHRPDLGVDDARPVGAALARHPREPDGRRRVARGVRLRELPHDRDRLAARARLAHLLRRRARLGALRADRAGREAVGSRPGGRRAARRRARRDRRLRHHRPAREVLPRLRVRARRGLRRRRGRHGVGQGQDARLRRQGRARHAPRVRAGRGALHADRRRPHVGGRHEALHARPRAGALEGRRAARRCARPPLVRDERRRRPVDRQAHPALATCRRRTRIVGEELLVEYLGEQYPVTVATNDSTPVFDPDNSRVKA